MIRPIVKISRWLVQLASPARLQAAVDGQARFTGGALHVGQQADLMVARRREEALFDGAEAAARAERRGLLRVPPPPREHSRQQQRQRAPTERWPRPPKRF